MANNLASKVWGVLAGLQLTIVCLVGLMVLVVACTLAQVELGTLGAVNAYIRGMFVWWDVPGTGLSVPVFPGGALFGLALAVNLVAAQIRRLQLTWKKSGLWLVHAGLVLLFAGEFVTSLAQVETQLSIEEGQTLNFVESPVDLELAVVDTTDPTFDDVFGVPDSLLARASAVELPGTPVTLHVKRFVRNCQLLRLPPGGRTMATMGVGTEVSVIEEPAVTRDDQRNTSAVFVEPMAGGKSYGTWLVSNELGAPQSFIHEGRTYVMSMRQRRQYLPYAITLKEFSHDVYAGTGIPKNFSSLVHISNKATAEERDVLIFMNQPLRYAGKAFYQASFGKNDTLSVLQVVENPGWLLPYISCSLVMLGLLIHFGLSLQRSVRRQQAMAAAAVEA